MVVEWWSNRSRIAVAIIVSPKTEPQSPQLLLLVRMMLLRS